MKEGGKKEEVSAEAVPFVAAALCYLQFAVLTIFGHLRDYCGAFTGYSRYPVHKRPGYAPLLVAFEHFYTKRIYHRLHEVISRPIASAPGAHIDVQQRYSPDGNKTLINKEGEFKKCLNLGSYNNLGFADDWMNTCSKQVFPVVDQFSVSSSSSLSEFGTTTVHRELEKTVAAFVGKEDAIVYAMGYGTNAVTIPALFGKGCLILSDELNHTSLVNGSRDSGATIQVFRHNDYKHLEKILRTRISEGQPRTHLRWRKIVVMVEGIYSMEGEILDLPAILKVTKKYKAYLYVDEAHSIGALGRTGGGICQYHNVDPKEVDFLVGTFSKSFAACGGYIAASKEVIAHIRNGSAGVHYAACISPVIAQQILTAFNIISGKDGTNLGQKKLKALRDNCNYFRQKLMDAGFLTLGHFDAPVIPIMLYHLSKVKEFSNLCMERNMAVVTVGFPATPLLLARARFCISAGHNQKDLDAAIEKLKDAGSICNVLFGQKSSGRSYFWPIVVVLILVATFTQDYFWRATMVQNN